jgi:hypothetical protein
MKSVRAVRILPDHVCPDTEKGSRTLHPNLESNEEIDMKIRELGVATLILVTGSGLALAADDAASTGTTLPSFEKVDADGNGAISNAEASAVPGLIDMFSTADVDKDGQLSKAEYSAANKT